MAECLRQNKQPGPLTEEIVTDYFTVHSGGAHLTLPQPLLKAIDRVAFVRGTSREEAILEILRRSVEKVLADILDEGKRLEQLGAAT